jgi:hypothetical protein
MRTVMTLLFLLCFAPRALAWGREGHQIVAELAQRQLHPAELAEVRRLLAGESDPSLAGVANWADELRDGDPERGKLTSRWHFINFPRGDCAFSAARDCPDGNCVVAAINRQFLVLSDARRPDAERAEALKFLVHFLGDVHQPLHAGFGDDRGGNDFQVNIGDEGSNLHKVWDSKIIETREPDFRVYADQLAKRSPLPFDTTGRSDRPAVDWAQESCRLVSAKDFYPPSHKIGAAYYRQNQAVVDMRLRQAGKRLADMLNYALQPRPAVAH